MQLKQNKKNKQKKAKRMKKLVGLIVWVELFWMKGKDPEKRF